MRSTRSSATSGSAAAPMSDLFLVLAQTDEGLSCFCRPPLPARRHQATRASSSSGSRTSWATTPTRPPRSSSTVRGARCSASRGAASATIIEMVGHTRLDCVMGGAGGMRTAVSLGHLACDAPRRVRQDTDRPAADAQRPRRPRRRERGRHSADAAALPRIRRGRGRRRARRSVQRAWPPLWPSTTSASASPTTPSKRWSASAATATSRHRACRASTARRRCARSGRARAT